GEREYPIVDRGIDGLAELDDEGGLSGIEKARFGQHRVKIGLQCHAATGLNGFSVTPACSNRWRTRPAVATAWSESPCTQIERIGVGRCLPLAVITAPACTIASTRAAASSAPSIIAPG